MGMTEVLIGTGAYWIASYSVYHVTGDCNRAAPDEDCGGGNYILAAFCASPY